MSDNTQKNHAHWNEASKTYNTQFSKTIQQIIDEIQARKDWIGVDWVEDDNEDEEEESETRGSGSRNGEKKEKAKEKRIVRLLDYACGTGLVSRALAPYVTQCVGIDLTEGMVREYNLSASNQGIPEEEMHAFVGNLISTTSPPPPELSTPSFHNFDIAVVGLGFHHFDDPALATRRLAERLRPGGVLMIIDFLPHGDDSSSSSSSSSPHSHGHSHSHSHSHSHNHNHNHQATEPNQVKKAEEHESEVEVTKGSAPQEKGTAPPPGIDHHHHHDHAARPNPSLTMSSPSPSPSPSNPAQPQIQTQSQSHPAAHTITHHGFAEAEVEAMFRAAGVGKDFSYLTIGKGIVFQPKSEGGAEMKRSVFFARGVKV